MDYLPSNDIIYKEIFTPILLYLFLGNNLI